MSRGTRMAVRARPLLAVVLVGALVAGTACGSITERKERADRIIDSVDRAGDVGTARLSVTAEATLKFDGAERLVAAGSPDARPTVGFDAFADLAEGRVAYLAPGDSDPANAARYYTATTMYVRRPDAGGASGQRPWVRLDLTSIDPDEIDNDDVETADAFRRVQQTQGFDNPLFLLSLLRGALSGSVEDLGAEDVRGVATTHYKLNIDREKAVRDEDEAIQDAYEALFKTMFATRTVLPGEVWLDDEGLPRRYSVTLRSSVRRRDLVDFRITVELFDIGQAVRLALPDKSQTARVESLGGLARVLGGGD